MATNQEVALNLVTSISAFIAADRQNSAEIIGNVVDLLLGTDPTALVTKVPGLTPTMFELLTDAIKDLAVDKIKSSMA